MAEQWVRDLLTELWSGANGGKLNRLEKLILRAHPGEMHELRRQFGRDEREKYLGLSQTAFDEQKEETLDLLAKQCAKDSGAPKAIRRFIFGKLRPGRITIPDEDTGDEEEGPGI